MKQTILFSAAFLLPAVCVQAQDTYVEEQPKEPKEYIYIAPEVDNQTPKPTYATAHGSIQADILFPETDVVIGTETYKEKVLGNIFGDLSVSSKYVDWGLRFEYLEHPLPGYVPDYKGWGVPNIYLKGKIKNFELTVGDFYDQFGSGFILRTYEDRALGIDNSIRGARFSTKNLRGMKFTVLGGVQRRFWDWDLKSQVYGADAEIYIDQLSSRLNDKGVSWTLGGSYVLKHESDEDIIFANPEDKNEYKLKLPKNVSAMDFRTQFSKNGWNLLAEYAWKSQDPSYFNNYTYPHGDAYMLSGSYSKSGMGVLLQAKRSENMAFHSKRSESEAATYINNMPPFAYQWTYALATIYPYATQDAAGEWAFQGQFNYRFKRKTPLGGKYGTMLKINASYIRGLKRADFDKPMGSEYGTNGGKTKFFGFGGVYYWDFDFQIEKRLVKDFIFDFTYVNQMYNKSVIEGEGGKVYSNIFIFEGKYTISKKVTARMELQYLTTKQDQKDWAYGLLEVSVLPYLMFSASDMWNCGGSGIHYYMGAVTANFKANRLMIGYGRTRAGYNCSGGVCRYVPAFRGLQVSYNYNF
ncbi:MAG: hypothetical protein J1E82_05060 [Muribaculaceae bacterium]|nr:hypothetical protein [Muribaculaceae bacterium]